MKREQKTIADMIMNRIYPVFCMFIAAGFMPGGGMAPADARHAAVHSAAAAVVEQAETEPGPRRRPTLRDDCVFEAFLALFVSVQRPISVGPNAVRSMWEEDAEEYVLPELPADCADHFLARHLPNFNTETYPVGFGAFNFPAFDEGGYRAFGRFPIAAGWAVMFALRNNASLYLGVATFSHEGRFIDQMFVTGAEGGSGVTRDLSVLLLAEGSIELSLRVVSGEAGAGLDAHSGRRQQARLLKDGTFELPVAE